MAALYKKPSLIKNGQLKCSILSGPYELGGIPTFSSSAPVPKSLPSNTALAVLKCWMVLGCSHITVFIAGANMKGLSGSQALKKHVAKLS